MLSHSVTISLPLPVETVVHRRRPTTHNARPRLATRLSTGEFSSLCANNDCLRAVRCHVKFSANTPKASPILDYMPPRRVASASYNVYQVCTMHTTQQCSALKIFRNFKDHASRPPQGNLRRHISPNNVVLAIFHPRT